MVEGIGIGESKFGGVPAKRGGPRRRLLVVKVALGSLSIQV